MRAGRACARPPRRSVPRSHTPARAARHRMRDSPQCGSAEQRTEGPPPNGRCLGGTFLNTEIQPSDLHRRESLRARSCSTSPCPQHQVDRQHRWLGSTRSLPGQRMRRTPPGRKRTSALASSPRPLGTSTKRAGLACADACSPRPKQASARDRSAQSEVVRSEHPTRELGDFRLNGRKQECAAGGEA